MVTIQVTSYTLGTPLAKKGWLLRLVRINLLRLPVAKKNLKASTDEETRGKNLIRSAKAGNEWTKNDLVAYNIVIKEEDEGQFFDLDGTSPLPTGISTVDPMILDRIEMPRIQTRTPQTTLVESTRKFYRYLKHASDPAGPDTPSESAVDDFAIHLLGPILGYDSIFSNGLIRKRMEITLKMSGEDKKAIPNIAILRDDNKIIFVDENKV